MREWRNEWWWIVVGCGMIAAALLLFVIGRLHGSAADNCVDKALPEWLPSECSNDAHEMVREDGAWVCRCTGGEHER